MSTKDSGNTEQGSSTQSQGQTEQPNLDATPQRVVMVTNDFKPKLDKNVKILNEDK